jgi:excisionase family DNA binding protein
MMTVAEAARRAGRNPETIRRWIREGKLTAWKVGTQHVIDEDDLTTALAGGGPPRRGGPGIIVDPEHRAIVSWLHQGRRERMDEITGALRDRAAELSQHASESTAAYATVTVDASGSVDAWLTALVGRIVRAVDPQRIILYGSQTTSVERQLRAYDLLVILDEPTDEGAGEAKIRRSIADLPVAVEVRVMKAEHTDPRWRGGAAKTTTGFVGAGRQVYGREDVISDGLAQLIAEGRVTPALDPDTLHLPEPVAATSGRSATEALLAERDADPR